MIEVDQISKIYGTTTALHGVSFHVEPGEIVGFLGPNGAGKTTTMRILAAYLPATSGTATIAGHDVHHQSMAVRRNIGYLPEIPPLYPDQTVGSFLHFVAKIKGVPPGDRREKVQRAIAKCQLQDKESVLIRKLSKGYRQRVGIAQAIVHDPPVIILDEPTAGLDPIQINEVRTLIKELAGDHTVLLSSHILPEVNATCDRIVIINKGQIVATDSPQGLMAAMGNQKGYELEIDGDPLQVQPLLQVIPGVCLVEIPKDPPPDYPQHHRLKITCAPDAEPGGDIVRVVLNVGINLYEMRRTRPSLEDVFLNLTTKE